MSATRFAVQAGVLVLALYLLFRVVNESDLISRDASAFIAVQELGVSVAVAFLD